MILTMDVIERKAKNIWLFVLIFTLLSFNVLSQELDPIGTNYKKTLISETLDKLTKRNLPSTQTGANFQSVYIFLVAYTNTSLRVTKPFMIEKYSDGTWPFAKEIAENYSYNINHPIDRIKLIGYFSTLDEALKEWNDLYTAIIAYGLRSEVVNFESKKALKADNAKHYSSFPEATQESTKKASGQSGINIINLPQINIKAKEKITLGIMPIIDSSSNLSQQFSIFQFLQDNPIVINDGDTLHATITDTRTFTYFAVSGIAGGKNYRLKIWQKDKLLAEIVEDFNPSTSDRLKSRLPIIAKQIGNVIGQGAFTLPIKLNFSNVYDYSNVIDDEINKGTGISSLFPHESSQYVPKTDVLPMPELAYLNSRILNKGFEIKNYNPIKGAQLVRAIYHQTDDKIFFMRNQNVPDDIKKQVKKIVQPTSKRIGSAISYLTVGIQGKEIKEYDFAAACFYSALLLTNKLSASAYEKAWLKKSIYGNMAEVYQKRNQPLLAEMFLLGKNLNDSFLKSESSKLAHVEYYKNIEKLAESTSSVETSAKTIQSSKNSAIWLGLATAVSTVGARGGLANLSNPDIARISNQIESSFQSVKESSMALIELAQDVDFSPVEVKDSDGVNIELNQLFLAREIISHILLRPDQKMVAKQIIDFAKDKPNLQFYMEEVYAEDDINYRNQAIDNLLGHLRFIEIQGTLYESRGRKVPQAKLNQF